MGRKERRLIEKLQKLNNTEEDARMEMEVRAKMKELVDGAIAETEEYVKNHITGELYTAMALVLRKAPYRWDVEKTMRFLGQVAAIINDLNEHTISDSDLVTAGEKVGIRVRWNASHSYITDLGIFEEAM